MGIYMRETYVPPELCFTANTAGSTVELTNYNVSSSVRKTLETSTDGVNRSTYSWGTTITLTNIGDKVYWRNASETCTTFSTYTNSYYYFVMTGSISASGDITYLINKNSTTTLARYCFYRLFLSCTSLTTIPALPKVTLASYCYDQLFNGCTSLSVLPNLYETTLPDYCYTAMFNSCTSIKLSETQTGEYQTPYRIPYSGTGTVGNSSLTLMFDDTGGTFTGTPSINTTYYTSNTVV